MSTSPILIPPSPEDMEAEPGVLVRVFVPLSCCAPLSVGQLLSGAIFSHRTPFLYINFPFEDHKRDCEDKA